MHYTFRNMLLNQVRNTKRENI